MSDMADQLRELRAENAKLKESHRVATERCEDLENGLTTLHLQFGEPYYSWQRVLYHVQALIRRRNTCAEACLNTIGFLDGISTITKPELTQRLVDAVRPILSGKDESPEFSQGVTSDAKLIRAAPELLKFCRWLLKPDRPMGSDAEFVREIEDHAASLVADATR